MTEVVEVRCTTVPRSQHQPVDRTRDQRAEAQYQKSLDDLVAEAGEAGQIHVLADGLAWTIARIGFKCGTAATGDILRRIGGYLQSLEVQRQASEQAAKAREEGLLPN